MKRTTTILIACAFSVALPAQAAPRVDQEARLAQALDGRTAGEPVNCINLRSVRSSQIIDGTAILYDTGGTIYVNRPRSGRESLDRWDTLVTKLHSSRLCSIDVVQLYDTSAGFLTGLVFLGDFVPYKRAR